MRRLYIINGNQAITAAVRNAASAVNCTEIVRGIPPRLVGEVSPPFPIVYEEPADPDVAPRAQAVGVLRDTYRTTRTAAQMNACIDAITVILRRVVNAL